MGLDTEGAGSGVVEHKVGHERVHYDEKILLHRVKYAARNLVGWFLEVSVTMAPLNEVKISDLLQQRIKNPPEAL